MKQLNLPIGSIKTGRNMTAMYSMKRAAGKGRLALFFLNETERCSLLDC
ncbi:hypothetical protein JN06_01431 [Bacteroides zoogleoformans]|nr:hypothetical protein JN06_01431 [Bacteroides zoogleoformans]